MSNGPRCKVCYDPLRSDGHCRYRCDPSLKRSTVRSVSVRAKQKAKAARVESERLHFSPEEQSRVGKKLAAIDPLYGQTHRRAVRAAVKSHRPGVRR